jgi:cytochrome c556
MKLTSRCIKRTLSAVAIIAVGAAIGTAGISPSDAQMSAIAKQRSDAMKQNGGNVNKLGAAVAAGDNAAAAAAAAAINAVASQIPALFPEGSGTGETRAKPEIWQNFADFRAKANALESASAKVVADANAGNLGSDPKTVVGSIGATCAACHKAYRAPKPE